VDYRRQDGFFSKGSGNSLRADHPIRVGTKNIKS
jgi:hypothetical protein